jgi:sec-independent protein translocase protein TatA
MQSFDYLALGLPGGGEWLWIVLVVVLLFGARKLPELARSLGRSLSEFKKGKDEGMRSITDADAAKQNQTGDSGKSESGPQTKA